MITLEQADEMARMAYWDADDYGAEEWADVVAVYLAQVDQMAAEIHRISNEVYSKFY